MYARMTYSGLGCRCLIVTTSGAYLGTSAELGEINLASYIPVNSMLKNKARKLSATWISCEESRAEGVPLVEVLMSCTAGRWVPCACRTFLCPVLDVWRARHAARRTVPGFHNSRSLVLQLVFTAGDTSDRPRVARG